MRNKTPYERGQKVHQLMVNWLAQNERNRPAYEIRMGYNSCNDPQKFSISHWWVRASAWSSNHLLIESVYFEVKFNSKGDVIRIDAPTISGKDSRLGDVK